jgi:hypothetical protein
VNTAAKFELTLVRSKDDLPRFGTEFLTELGQFGQYADPPEPPVLAMDGGGELIDFLFTHADALITAISVLGAAWLHRCPGRRYKLKVGTLEIEANTEKEVDAMLKRVRALQESRSKIGTEKR